MSKIISINMKKLRKEIDKVLDEYLQKITKVIISALKSYPEGWIKNYHKIEDLFYDFLVEVYKIVIKYLEKQYGKNNIPDFEIEDIFELAYDIDGKSITERLREYWDEAADKIKIAQDQAIIQNYLINMYDRILFTESRVVESKLKKIKKPNNASLLIIESGCELCQGGEFPPDEDVVLPPFHPYCNCTYYYEITDSEDDINDLDLEIEE